MESLHDELVICLDRHEAHVLAFHGLSNRFSVDEIAGAFISNHSAVEKRILRAKKVLAGSKRLFDITAPADFSARLPAVHRALYLLFNEGYHGASAESAVRFGLCTWPDGEGCRNCCEPCEGDRR